LEKKNQKTNFFKAFECSETTRKFLQRFVGLSTFMNNEFNKIYYDSLENKNKKEEKKEAEKSFTTQLWKFISELSFFLFFIFTILCLFFMKNTSSDFIMANTMADIFSSTDTPTLTENEFKTDLLNRFDILFHRDDGHQHYKEIVPITPLRIAIVYFINFSIKRNRSSAPRLQILVFSAF
jgi:hypothetical protein